MASLQEQAAETLMDLSQALRVNGYSEGLKPGQWAALRYLSRAAAQDRTLSAFAAHRGISLGAAAQTIDSLVARGFVTRSVDDTDRRRRALALTLAGVKAMKSDPSLRLLTALEGLAIERIWLTDQTVRQVMDTLSGKNEASDENGTDVRISPLRQQNHDVREILTTIIGMADAMQHEQFGPVPSLKYQEYADAIRLSGETLLDLLSQTAMPRAA